MGVEASSHHGESITPAQQPSVQSSFQNSPIEKPMHPEGIDTPIPRITVRSLVMALFVSMGGLLFGYDTGQISGFQEMSNYLERYGELNADGSYAFSTVRSGLIVGLLSIGTMIGALVGAPVADMLGRKWSITLWCMILNVGLIVQISSPDGHWYQMVVGRWVTGLGVGGCSLLVPMYQGESAPRHIRGAMISCYQLFVTLGIFLAYCINLGTHALDGTAQWRITLGITFLFALVLGGGMAFFPESPRYEFRHGKAESAQSTLAKLYGIPENHVRILEEMREIREQFEAEADDQKWHEFLTAPCMFYRIALGMVLQSLQQLSGANYFFYYVSSYINCPFCILREKSLTAIFLTGYHYLRRCWSLRQLCDPVHSRRCELRHYIWWLVCRRKLRSPQVPNLRSDLDVCHVYDLLVPRPFRSGCGNTYQYPQCRQGYDCCRLPIYCGICHDLGSHGLGYCRRAFPFQVPCQGYGLSYRNQLAVELPHQLLHNFHH